LQVECNDGRGPKAALNLIRNALRSIPLVADDPKESTYSARGRTVGMSCIISGGGIGKR
jgi:hypothetical protein